jgi:hypothetical protein
MNFSTACISRISLPTAAAKLVLAIAMLSGGPVAQAAKTDLGVCQDLDKAERGLCRAAIRSGCALDGRNLDSIRCSKLASNYRRMTDGDNPIWLKSDDAD